MPKCPGEKGVKNLRFSWMSFETQGTHTRKKCKSVSEIFFIFFVLVISFLQTLHLLGRGKTHKLKNFIRYIIPKAAKKSDIGCHIKLFS